MIEIQDGDLCASLCPERGGIVTSLRFAGREYLYLDAATLADPDKNVRGGIPILFPICGPLADGVWHYQGQDYRMPQHGLARQARWQRLAQEASWVELGFQFTPETLKQYPFAFSLKFRYSVQGRVLSLDQTYSNLGEQSMPFQCGLHPYFQVDSSQLHWDLPVESGRDNEVANSQASPWDGLVPTDWPVLDWEMSGLSARSASLQQIRLGYDEHYRYLVIWHLAGKPFWCLEPWSGPRFGLQRGIDVLHCPPGESITTRVSLEIMP